MNASLAVIADGDLQILATALRSGRLVAPFTRINVGRILGEHVHENLLKELQILTQLQFTESQIASCLDLLLRDRAHRPRADHDLIDLVTTGPETGAAVNRDTSVVVRELFFQSKSSVVVVGYAIHQGKQVFQALADRMLECPELRVQLFVDIRRGPGDTTTSEELLRRFKDNFLKLQWLPGRPIPQVYYDPRSLEQAKGPRSALHAKCVVIDRSITFVSSANFTEAAQERNIEVGLLVRSSMVAERLVLHFESLADQGFLKPLW